MAALAAEVVGSFLYGGAGPVQVCGDLEVCGFNHWQIKTLREYDCRDIVLVQPTTRSKKKPTAAMKTWYKGCIGVQPHAKRTAARRLDKKTVTTTTATKIIFELFQLETRKKQPFSGGARSVYQNFHQVALDN